MRHLILVVALLALTGCGSTLRAIAGPDPAFEAIAPGLGAALDRDSIAHPEMKPQNDHFKEVLAAVLNPQFPPLPLPVPGPWGPIVAVGIPGALALYHSIRRAFKGNADHEDNAARIDELEKKHAALAAASPTPPAA